MGRLLALVLCLAVGVAAYVLIRGAVDRPSVPDLVKIAREEMVDDARTATARKVDGLGFPDWRRYGWNARSGRLDRLEDDREAATVLYRRGGDEVTYTIVSGTGNVDDESVTLTRQISTPRGKVEIVQAGTDRVSTLKRKRDGRTILMTGAPPSDRLARTMRRLSVRGVGSGLG